MIIPQGVSMSEMSLEELIDKLCVIEISPNEMISVKAEILSRFADLQAEKRLLQNLRSKRNGKVE
jgi:hypothetical protein